MSTATQTRPRTGPDDAAVGAARGTPADVRREVKQMVSEGLTGLAAATARDCRATAWRLRRQLAPHVLTGTVWLTGAAEHAIVAHGASPAQVATVMTAITGPIVLASWRAARKRRPRWARRVLLAGLGTASWLACVAPHGVEAMSAASLAAFELAIAARWWQANRIPIPIPIPGTAEDAETAPDIEAITEAVTDTAERTAAQILADWISFVGGQGGCLPGASLTLPEKTKHGWAFTLRLAKGKQDISAVHAALGGWC